MASCTPSELIDEFRSLNGFFPTIQALTEKIREISTKYKCPFISYSAGPSRLTQIYACSHLKTIFNCQAKAKFSYEDGFVRFVECDKEHSHKPNEPTRMNMRNCLTLLQRERIKHLTTEGQSAYSIRLRENLKCTKDVLYNIRRPILENIRAHEMENLLHELNNGNSWINNVLKENDTNVFCGCHCIHDVICNKSYAKDICIVDDTSCTNKYGFPVLVMIVEDENGRSQLLAFSLMKTREATEFDQFFEKVKAKVGDIRLFVADRNQIQMNSIKRTWPNCLIINCSIHIGRNIRSVSVELYNLYEKMRHLQITEEEFLNACIEFIQDDTVSDGKTTIQNIIDTKEYWLPSVIIKYKHCDNETSNRAEGFFGSLKNLLEHKIETLANVIRAIYIRAERMYLSSINEKPMSVPDELISEQDSFKVGKLALSLVYSEYIDLNKKGSLMKEYSPDCCKIHAMFDLPCRHLMLKRILNDDYPILTLADFSERWIRADDYNVTPPNNQTFIIPRQKPANADNSYSSYLARFERYFSSAARSASIRQILDNCINELQTNEHQNATESDELQPPSSIPLAGRPFTHPRNNVDFKTNGKKKKYHCSHCGSDDHTLPRCPFILRDS